MELEAEVMKKPRICAVIIDKDDVEAALDVEQHVDLFEVRIDLVGDGWQEVAKQLNQPWLATNRMVSEGGNWQGDEDSRVVELFKAMDLGAKFVDIELRTQNVKRIVETIKRSATCIVSFHDWEKMPSLEKLEGIVREELEAGADICKVAAKAEKFEDNATILELIGRFPEAALIALSFGPLGTIGRTLSPLMGGYLTYAAAGQGKESAPGQVPVRELRKIYDMWVKT
jgi:3-dehydroquinate dehydratase type I